MKETKFEKIGLMLDCSRNGVPKAETLKTLIDFLSNAGYNRLELYTEDVYEIKTRPYFGYFRGRYSGAEIKEIDAYAYGKGIELTPCIQVLAHLNGIFRGGHFDDVRDCDDILLADEPETYKLIEDMFISLAENFTSREVNIGCDESFMLGRGQYLDRFGYKNRFEIFCRHLEKVLDIADKYGFKCSIWDDMFFRTATGGAYDNSKPIPHEVLSRIPEKLSLIYYNYTAKTREMFDEHKQFKNEIEFAGGAWKWLGFAPDNGYSIKCAKAAIADAKEYGIKKVMVTAWGDDGCEASVFSVLPALYFFGRAASGESVATGDLEKGFRKLTGTGFREFMSLDVNGFKWLKKMKGFHGKASNAEKVFLYNDCFCGVYDGLLTGGEGQHYAEKAKVLKAAAKGKFSYIFKTMGALCDVLSLKAEIGVKTRKAYRDGDKGVLRKIAGDYGEIIKRASAFYALYRKQWMRENKPFGFEIQDIRIGGFIQRIKDCRKTLLDYCAGKIADIPELGEEILLLTDGIVDEFGCFMVGGYSKIVTVNNI